MLIQEVHWKGNTAELEIRAFFFRTMNFLYQVTPETASPYPFFLKTHHNCPKKIIHITEITLVN